MGCELNLAITIYSLFTFFLYIICIFSNHFLWLIHTLLFILFNFNYFVSKQSSTCWPSSRLRPTMTLLLTNNKYVKFFRSDKCLSDLTIIECKETIIICIRPLYYKWCWSNEHQPFVNKWMELMLINSLLYRQYWLFYIPMICCQNTRIDQR